MTFAPARLLDARAYLLPRTGLSNISLGIVGDERHLGGYHHGWDQRRTTGDYSWSESVRDSSHRTNAARALDIGMFARLRELSVWLVEQCKANTPDTQDIREVIYSPDGQVVRRWDRLGRRSTGDSSHLTHTHISFFADAEDRDKTAVFRRFFEGDDDMTPEQARDLAAAAWRIHALANLHPAVTGGPTKGEEMAAVTAIQQLAAGVAELKARPATPPVHLSDGDRVAIVAMLKDELAPLIGSLRAEVRDAVADGLEGGSAAVRADQ